jgi:WD40 repeat protein
MSATIVPPSPGAPASAVVRVYGAHPFHTDGDLVALRFAADGTLWSVEEPGVLRHWDVGGRRQLAGRAFEHPATLWRLSDGGRYLAAAGDDLLVWNAATGQCRGAWAQPCWATAVAFRPDAAALAVGYDDGAVRLWDWAGRRLLLQLPGHAGAVSALAFSGDGRRLASAGEDRVVRLWDARDGEPLGRLDGHTDRIPALAWHPDGRRLFSAGWDTTARVWDVDKRQPIILLNSHAGQVFTLALTPDGRRLACADSAHTVHVWDAERYREVSVRTDAAAEVRCLAWSADGRRLAAGGADRIIHLWDAGEAAAAQPDGLCPAVTRPAVAVHPDGRRLTGLGAGAALRVWDVDGGAEAPLADADDVAAFVASPDGRWLAAGRAAGAPGLWDATTGRRAADLDGPKTPTSALAFAADSALLASGGEQSPDVWLWRVPSGEPALLIPGAANECAVAALAFHPRQPLLAVGGVDFLATGGSDGCVVLWDVGRRARRAVFRGAAVGLTFHPAGRRLAAASPGQAVRVWDLEADALAAEWAAHGEAITCVAYSPDGRWLATGGDDRTVRLWDADTGMPGGRAELDTQVKALAFSPDGRRLFTANGNGSCYQLDVERFQ